MDLRGFNANNYESNNTFETIPPGEYDAVIIESEGKETKDKMGRLLKLKLQIVSGPYQNRTLYTNLNIKNRNPTAQQIAEGQLSDICKAVGVIEPQDSNELHMKPLRIKVAVRKRDDTGELVNEVKAYKPRSGVAAATPPAAQSFAPVNGASAPVRAPWGNN